MYRQIVGIPMATNNCAPLVADLFLFCYEKDSMYNNQTDVIEALTLPQDI